MKVSNISELLDAELLIDGGNLGMEIHSACGADLMSDVMAYVKENNIVLLTGLINPQVVRTAEMMNIRAIVFVRGKNPGKVVLDLAREKGITVFTTDYPMFIACGKLYCAGVGKGACS